MSERNEEVGGGVPPQSSITPQVGQRWRSRAAQTTYTVLKVLGGLSSSGDPWLHVVDDQDGEEFSRCTMSNLLYEFVSWLPGYGPSKPPGVSVGQRWKNIWTADGDYWSVVRLGKGGAWMTRNDCGSFESFQPFEDGAFGEIWTLLAPSPLPQKAPSVPPAAEFEGGATPHSVQHWDVSTDGKHWARWTPSNPWPLESYKWRREITGDHWTLMTPFYKINNAHAGRPGTACCEWVTMASGPMRDFETNANDNPRCQNRVAHPGSVLCEEHISRVMNDRRAERGPQETPRGRTFSSPSVGIWNARGR